jgi:hypothetical protein
MDLHSSVVACSDAQVPRDDCVANNAEDFGPRADPLDMPSNRQKETS